MHDHLIAPHGGTLVDLMVPASERDAVRASADRRVECSDRNACDVELLVVGGFSPLRGFMHQEDYEAVVEEHRTTSGLLFGLPIILNPRLLVPFMLVPMVNACLALLVVQLGWVSPALVSVPFTSAIVCSSAVSSEVPPRCRRPSRPSTRRAATGRRAGRSRRASA